jgi:hypothetical protein
MTQLTDKELRALRSMPAFVAALYEIDKEEIILAALKKAEHDAKHTACPGDPEASEDRKGRICGVCGLYLKYSDFGSPITLNRLIEGKHWKHENGGNPAREDGLYGKSAAAADGDWYSSH